MSRVQRSPPGLGFLAGGGEMGRLIRSFDWASHPLGGPAGWPQSLKTVLRLLLSTGHPMFLWWSPELYQFYNDAYRRSIGPERHPTALGQPGRECWVEIWDIIGPQIEQVMSGGGHTWHENQLVPITGYGRREDVYWTYSYGPVDDPGAANGIGGVLVVCSETTEQVLAEKRMREAEARWRSLFEQTPGFVCILGGPDHVFEFANDRYRDLVGGRELIGKPMREALPEVGPQGFFRLLDEVYRTGRPHRGTATPVVLQSDSGEKEVFVDFVYQPIEDADGEVVGVFVDGYDVTDRVVAHAKLRREDRRKDEFLAMLAHELRNPLAPIRNAGEILVRGEDMGERARALGGLVSRQVHQMARLVDDLLDVSRITRDQIELREEPLDVGGLVASAIEAVQPHLAEMGHEIVRSGEAVPVSVAGDRVRLVQCISNLLTNASKYTPTGGRIEIRLARQGDHAVVEVADTGIGIAPDLLPQVFDLFMQADRSLDRPQSGLGVGLYIVRRLVEMHGGEVEASSEGLGRGSTFRIRLPVSETGAGADASPERGQPSPLRILVVDDHADSADSLVELLRLRGHQAESVNDPHRALERVAEEPPEVVLLDIGLPGIDGYEVARRLRAGGLDCVLIAVTGYGRAEDRDQAEKAGFDAHLIKPVPLEELERVLRETRRQR